MMNGRAIAGGVGLSSAASLFRTPSDVTQIRPVILYPSAVVFGDGTAELVGGEARVLGSRALLVTYSSLWGREEDRPLGRVLRSLEDAGVRVELFELPGEPDTHAVDACGARAVEVGAELVIGLGGGSILDTAKAASGLVGNGGSWSDYQFGVATLTRAGLPVVAIPTTAGTGSEATSVAVIHDRERGLIKSVSSPLMLPRVVIIDPTLTWSCPPRLTALVGLDAITHAIESYLSPRASRLTRALSLQALSLLVDPLVRAVQDGTDREARSSLALGSHFAGQALSAGVGAAHILAQPISATLGVAHGEALAAVLVAVLAFDEEYPSQLFADLAPAFDSPYSSLSLAVRDYLARVGLPTTLSAIGGRESDVAGILSKVAESTGHVWTNVRPVALADLERILRASI
jgi:alcohol dehydrogenase class IV